MLDFNWIELIICIKLIAYGFLFFYKKNLIIILIMSLKN